MTPKQFVKTEFRIKQLHHYLCIYDRRWEVIPPTEVKTTLPRTLVHSMNTHLQRWKNNYAAVQKVIDNLPEAREPSVEVEQTKDLDPTESEHSNQGQEELKDEKFVREMQSRSAAAEQNKVVQKKSGQQSFAGQVSTLTVQPDLSLD